MEMTEKLVDKCFPNSECVMSVHTDKEHLHSHIIVNSVCFNTGKMLQISPQKYTRMKDYANQISEQYGFSVVDFRKPSKVRQSTAERQIISKGGTSWKEELREVIDLAKRNTSNMVDFEKFLNNYGVTLSRNTEKSISYLHPEKKQAIRGERLGADYTKGAILNEFNQQRNRSSSWEQTGTVSTERKRTSENDNSTTNGNQQTIDISNEENKQQNLLISKLNAENENNHNKIMNANKLSNENLKLKMSIVQLKEEKMTLACRVKSLEKCPPKVVTKIVEVLKEKEKCQNCQVEQLENEIHDLKSKNRHLSWTLEAIKGNNKLLIIFGIIATIFSIYRNESIFQ